MSERANGWLLIFGGLAIGLVLWLSPSRSASSRELASMARQDLDGLIRSVVPRHRLNSKLALMTWLMDLCACTIDCEALASD